MSAYINGPELFYITDDEEWQSTFVGNMLSSGDWTQKTYNSEFSLDCLWYDYAAIVIPKSERPDSFEPKGGVPCDSALQGDDLYFGPCGN